MTEEEQQEYMKNMAQKVAFSFAAAASEVLGTNNKIFDDYFTIQAASLDDEIFIMVGEHVTEEKLRLPIPIGSLAAEESDKYYYSKIKEIIKAAEPFIPEDLKVFPKDNWPVPVWKEQE